MADLPYMSLFVQDFDADTTHLTLVEDGVYNRLLRLCWRTSGCSIPDDPAWIARRMRVDIKIYHEVVEPIIREFFTKDKGRVFQKRQREEWARAIETFSKRSAAGKNGGRPRKPLKNNETGESREKAGKKPGESNQNQNQNHIKNYKTGTLEDKFLSLIGLEPGEVAPTSPWAYLGDAVEKWENEFSLDHEDILAVARMVMARNSAPKSQIVPAYFEGPMHDHAMRKAGIKVPFKRMRA